MHETEAPSILVVDDKPNVLRLMAKVLRGEGRVFTASSGLAAIRLLEELPIAAVLCDLRMPDMDGLEVLSACKRIRPQAAFILMTAYATVPTAVEALRLGVFDYLTKPFDPEDARQAIRRALGQVSLTIEREDVVGSSTEILPGILACSETMRTLGIFVRRVAASDATVLILGETGTGKERIARAIHQLSRRAQRRFVALNCAAIPADLMESELFGYAKGAFSGAGQGHAGLFEEAEQGTLFLDEIAEMRTSLQAKLTRALEERAIRRLGEAQERPYDVRLLAATHGDMDAMVAGGTFRQDLWYRLNVAVVKIPALRERREDVELLATHFLKEYADVPGSELLGFTPAASEALLRYDWPGNVRQLRAAVQRACIMVAGTRIDVGDLPPEVTAYEPRPKAEQQLLQLTWAEAQEQGRRNVADHYLRSVLDMYAGDIKAAAAHAGVERESFYRLLRRFGVYSEIQEPPAGKGQ